MLTLASLNTLRASRVVGIIVSKYNLFSFSRMGQKWNIFSMQKLFRQNGLLSDTVHCKYECREKQPLNQF